MNEPLLSDDNTLWHATAAPRPLEAARHRQNAVGDDELQASDRLRRSPAHTEATAPLLPASHQPHGMSKPASVAPAPAPSPSPGFHHHVSLTRPEREVDAPSVTSGAPLIPSSIDLGSPEGVALAKLAGGAFMSQVVMQLWPQLSHAVEAQVREMLPALLENSKPTWLEDMTLETVTLGHVPPIVRSVTVDKEDDCGGCRREVRMVMEVHWDSQSSVQLALKMMPSTVTRLLPKVLQGVVSYMTSLNVGVKHLAIKGHVLLTLGPLFDTLPLIRQAQVSLIKTPDVDFNITLTKGEVQVLNIVKPFLRSTIAAAFASMVVPEHMYLPFDLAIPDVHKPEGTLLVRVLKATGVPKMDYWGHSDTYVDVWVRGRTKSRTPVIKNSAEPEWSEDEASFQLLVHYRSYQVLSFELWDEDNEPLDDRDDLIGGASIPLADLEPGKEHTLALQVFNAGSGARGDEAPPGIDPAHAGGYSKVDVSNTKLHVAVRYIPATLASHLVDVVGYPGTFVFRMTKVVVPTLEILPVKVRPYLTGQQPCATPPLSHSIMPRQGRDPTTGEDVHDRLDIPFVWDAVWDVLGSQEQVLGGTFVLELVKGDGTKEELVVSRVEVPLASVMARKIPGYHGGAGGGYTLHSTTKFQFETELLWYPLIDPPAPTAEPTVPEAGTGIGLQQLLVPLTGGLLNLGKQQEQAAAEAEAEGGSSSEPQTPENPQAAQGPGTPEALPGFSSNGGMGGGPADKAEQQQAACETATALASTSMGYHEAVAQHGPKKGKGGDAGFYTETVPTAVAAALAAPTTPPRPATPDAGARSGLAGEEAAAAAGEGKSV